VCACVYVCCVCVHMCVHVCVCACCLCVHMCVCECGLYVWCVCAHTCISTWVSGLSSTSISRSEEASRRGIPWSHLVFMRSWERVLSLSPWYRWDEWGDVEYLGFECTGAGCRQPGFTTRFPTVLSCLHMSNSCQHLQ
jgi:hypothetical protein